MTLCLMTCLGCVGPTTPFGGVNLGTETEIVTEIKVPAGAEALAIRPTLRFTPERQVLHGPSTMTLIISDPAGVPSDIQLKVTYDGLNVTNQFLRHGEIAESDPSRHEVRITSRHLRLIPGRPNKIKFVYKHNKTSEAVVVNYLPPTCSALADNQMLFAIPDFDPPLVVLQLINQRAAEKKLNPFFVAALVAQESSFDPRALSSRHALGLTQVTSLGEAEIIGKFNDWPRYPGVNEISFPVLKFAIATGRIHSGNEWRLDPALSIQGGIEYLAYLSDYWHRTEKREQIERRVGISETDLAEVILASYNSGATRVSHALEQDGRQWLANDELDEAQKYVRRVVSYCDYFEHRKE